MIYHIYLFLKIIVLARYAAILQNTPCLAMLSLFNISSNDASKIPQRHSQSMCLFSIGNDLSSFLQCFPIHIISYYQ